MAISETIDENRRHLLSYRQELIARFLSIPRGALKLKTIKGQRYIYLQRRKGDTVSDVYVGKADDPESERVAELVRKRARLLAELRSVKESLRGLSIAAKELSRQDFTPELRELFLEMQRAGMWEAGLEIVGSWCFTFYQQYFGVEEYPIRTLDIDIGIPLPYQGPEKDISGLLRRLGFEERYHYAAGVVTYIKDGYVIELLGPERGRSGRPSERIPPLKVNAQLLRFMDLLLENKIYVTVSGVGRVAIPSMPAFLLHKLLVAPRRKRQDKMHKDLRQAWEVALAIWKDQLLAEKAERMYLALLPSWKTTIRNKAVPLLVEHVVGDREKVNGILGRILAEKMSLKKQPTPQYA
jgi:hypothetical protein